jgi:hypothetical protein
MDILDQYDFVDTDFMDENSCKFESLIGEYLISFSYLEHSLDELISDLINDGTHQIGFLITAEMNMASKIDLLKRFVSLEKHVGMKRPRRIHPLLGLLKEANKFRNQLAHANWSSMREDGKTRTKVKVNAESGVYFQNVDLSAITISQETIKLEQLLSDIDNLELE